MRRYFMKKLLFSNKNNYALFFFLFVVNCLHSQNALFIPDTLSGTTFNLNIQAGKKLFFPGHDSTPTYGYNGVFLGPTLIIKKGDDITLHVTNNVLDSTTVHWHGFHVAAIYDGGPHQRIYKNTTWSPSFKMLNQASTFWYHPHGLEQTESQMSAGLAGMIIVRDNIEASYVLPRKYGVDDFPLIVQSKAFDAFYQIGIGTHRDKTMMVNGTIDPSLQVPKQVVRFRLLNASSDRTYYFGLSDNSNFNLIASDGGLLSKPYTTNRVRLSTGERVEILIDFGNDTIGQKKYLMSYASELPNGIIGADSVGTNTIVMGDGYYSNPLNGTDFNILRFDVVAPTVNPVITIPSTFAPINHIPESAATLTRNIRLSPDTAGINGIDAFVEGPFFINDKMFDMDSINIVTYLNTTEIWKLTNSTMIAHPFHIHDIEFFVLDINGNPPPPEYAGYKDVILVKPNDTVRFITKFTDFADDMVPYMYHCHLLHHEDDGMMGTFLVLDTTSSGIHEPFANNQLVIYPNPSSSIINIQFLEKNSFPVEYHIVNLLGEIVLQGKLTFENSNKGNIDISNLTDGIYLIKLNNSKFFHSAKIIKN